MAEEREEEETGARPTHLPPTVEPAHSPEGPLPRSWREAIPYVVWVVLILGFGLELTTALVHADWLRAFISFCAMVGTMTIALHWPTLRTWAARISPNWVVGAFLALLISVALMPFIEQERWPFASWFDAVTEAQKVTLIDWLQQAQRERDNARDERDQVKEQINKIAPNQDTAKIESLQLQLDAANRDLALARKSIVDFERGRATAGPAPVASAPHPQYLAALRFNIDFAHDKPLVVYAVSAVTTDDLRLSVDYQTMSDSGWEPMKYAHVTIGSSKVEKDAAISEQLIYYDDGNKNINTRLHWGNTTSDYSLPSPQLGDTINYSPIVFIRGRIVIRVGTGPAQYWYFNLLQLPDTAPTPNKLWWYQDGTRDWQEKWDRE